MTKDTVPSLAETFFADMAKLCRNELTAAGYKVASKTDAETCVFNYFNVLKRRIPAGRRAVWHAKEFKCPTAYRTGLRKLMRKVEKGKDLNPHQSRTLSKSDYNDALLNDWGIHHLHLGEALDSSGFSDRTGPLLFAMVTPKNFYCLSIMEHGPTAKKAPWVQQKLIQTIHANWPETIARYRVRGISMAANFDDDQLRRFRRAGVTVLTHMPDGTIYSPPGGGYSTSGLSMQVVMASDQWRRNCRHLAKHVVDNLEALAADFGRSGIALAPPYDWHLEVADNVDYVIERNAGAGFPIDSLFKFVPLR